MESASRTFFLGNACQVCKSKSTPYTCEVCRMIFYCSPEHRRENWFDHSLICWAFNKITQSGNRHHLLELFHGKDFTKFRHDIASRCKELLKRDLRPWEFEIIYYPRICEVCREFDWKKLKPCPGCEFIYTCDKQHFRENHQKWCKTLKIYSDLVIYQSLEGLKISNLSLEIKNQTYDSMSDVLTVNFAERTADKSYEVDKALISELLTYPLTVLNGLKRVNLLERKQIDILFIGAEIQAEVEPFEKWEKCLLHTLDKVDVLNLSFLGPELRMNSGETLGSLCEHCRVRGKLLKFEFITGKFYHQHSNGSKRPDLICAFNSGMYRDFGFGSENSWQETILELFSRKREPVLITEYTLHELKLVLERIRSLSGEVHFIVPPEMNPFAGLKPGLNIISEKETPVIFKNYYQAILQNRKQ